MTELEEINWLRHETLDMIAHHTRIVEGWQAAYEHALSQVPLRKRQRVRSEAAAAMKRVWEST